MEENEEDKCSSVCDFHITASDDMPLVYDCKLEQCDKCGDEVVEIVLTVIGFHKIVIFKSGISTFILQSPIFSIMFFIS